MTQGTNIFRVLIKTLLKAGIITDRTRHVYQAWVDMDELAKEDDEVAGHEVAMAAICVLEKGQALKIISGQRHMTLKAKDLGHYAGARGRRGSALPRGWRKVERMLAE